MIIDNMVKNTISKYPARNESNIAMYVVMSIFTLFNIWFVI